MKKFLALLLAVLCWVISLSANDVADVKTLIVKEFELISNGDFVGVLPLLTKDYRGPKKFNYKQMRWMFLGLDGKHLEEFMLFTAFVFKGGAELTPDDLEQIQATLRHPDAIKIHAKTYPPMAKQFAERLKRSAALKLETLEFISVNVDGDQAIVVLTYRQEGRGIIPAREKLSLRKIDGVWQIARRELEGD